MAVQSTRPEQHRAIRPDAARAILRWYADHARTFAWRNIRNPYRLLVAEVMLHQTQAVRVIQRYPEFLRRFPTLHALAAARLSEVVVAWRGMGYNNRAVRLHRLAKTLASNRRRRYPETVEEWQNLPGIGRYSAHALVVSIARRDLPVVDINIRRVYSRMLWRMSTTAGLRPEQDVWHAAGKSVPSGRGYEWMQALMDLGATVCTARSPRCAECPVDRMCASGHRMRNNTRGKTRPEPSMDGVPNRFYRGRIVDLLRAAPRGLPRATIGKKLLGVYSRKHEPWLAGLLAALERDGLIRAKGTGVSRCIELA